MPFSSFFFNGMGNIIVMIVDLIVIIKKFLRSNMGFILYFYWFRKWMRFCDLNRCGGPSGSA